MQRAVKGAFWRFLESVGKDVDNPKVLEKSVVVRYKSNESPRKVFRDCVVTIRRLIMNEGRGTDRLPHLTMDLGNSSFARRR